MIPRHLGLGGTAADEPLSRARAAFAEVHDLERELPVVVRGIHCPGRVLGVVALELVCGQLSIAKPRWKEPSSNY
jgi:hypothetical protein